MVDLDKDRFWEQVRIATKLVASWPIWKQNILVQSGKPTVDMPRVPIKYPSMMGVNMTASELTRLVYQCYGLDSLPKIRDTRGNCYILVNHFQIYFWIHEAHSKEVLVNILHPDGDKLEIIHTFTGHTGSCPEWVHWDHGAWDSAFVEACSIIEAAYERVQKEHDARLAESQREAERKLQEKINKFEALFNA
jgi:hypothetical protein